MMLLGLLWIPYDDALLLCGVLRVAESGVGDGVHVAEAGDRKSDVRNGNNHKVDRRSEAQVSNTRPAGRMRPTTSFYPAPDVCFYFEGFK